MNDVLTNVPPPGQFIKEELDARGLAQRDLAYILGTTEQVITRLINGKYGISPEMAKALGKAFDVNPELFVNMQSAYDMARAPDPDPGVERRARLQNVYPVREMINRGWLKDANATKIELQMVRFFKVANTNEITRIAYAAKKTNFGEEATPAQIAWLYRVLQIAESIPVKPYSERALRAQLEQLRALTTEPEEVRHVPSLLEQCGIRFIIVEGLPGGKIDGVCCWLNSTSPVIGMSLRFDRIDNFWFVLRHEIEHVLRQHGRIQEIIDVNLDRVMKNPSLEEAQANVAAAEFCVPQDKLQSFIVRKAPLFSERDILAFAKSMRIHPGLVIGQLQRRTERWDFLKRHQVKIRQFITRVAITDGWGDVAPVSV